MATITVDNLQSKRILVKDKSEKLLEALLRETDWMHACGGKGRCTTCKARILKGSENLTERTEAENRYLQANMIKKNERLTCQAHVLGDITIEVPKVYQLPHLRYS